MNTYYQDKLKSLVLRLENLEREKAAIATDISEIYREAKGQGFDTKTLRKVIQLRRLEAHERAEQEALLELYMGALVMLNGTPLGDAALKREGMAA